MSNNTLRWYGLVGLGFIVSTMALAAPPRPLSDNQLDEIYAAGFEVRLDVDLKATDPDSVIITTGDPAALQRFVDHGLTMASRASGGGAREGATLDPTGATMLNANNIVNNNISITDNALQNATTLMNVFALQGDVAIGVNLTVVVNPGPGVNLTVNQNNYNWATWNLSSAFQTLTPTGSN